MNILKLSAASALITLFLAACGGSGSSRVSGVESGTPDVPQNTSIDTVISGIATKGPIDGSINIYVLSDSGNKGKLLKSAPVVFGRYSTNIGKYAGPVIIEATGSYTDEATGQTRTISASEPMRAALSDASGAIRVAVTPLTELAVQKAGGLTASGIDAGNKLVSDIFKIDIINTLPVAPTSDALGKPEVKQSQKEYTLALAAISQLSKNRSSNEEVEPLCDTLKSVASSISQSGMNSQTVASFKKAVSDIKAGKTELRDVSSTNLDNIGTVNATYKLSIEGSIAANAIKGIQFEIVIPAGLTVRFDPASNETLSGIVTASTSISAAQPLVVSNFSASSGVLAIGLISSTGIGAGDLATITCDILPGWTVPPANAFSVRNIKAVDVESNTLGNVNVKVN